jgi:catechol 2,3-dioxygenase-like lactoylglutathione lyase family enzyme
MLESIDHVNLVVQDLMRMTEFYERALGLRVSKRVTIAGPWVERTVGLADVKGHVVYLELPQGPRIELIQYERPAMGKERDEQAPPNAHGIRHIAFRVSDIDALVQRLATAGVKFFSDVQTVPSEQVTYVGGARKRLVYFRDPEGNILELCEYR